MNTISKSYYQLLREDYDMNKIDKILDNIKELIHYLEILLYQNQKYIII